MTKEQALNEFWNGFNWLAFDANSVPEMIDDGHGNMVKLEPPYITYELQVDSFGNQVMITASLWVRSSSWASITAKEQEISDYITRGGRMIAFTGGAMWVQKGTPWAQRMGDQSDEMIKRIILNTLVEYLD